MLPGLHHLRTGALVECAGQMFEILDQHADVVEVRWCHRASFAREELLELPVNVFRQGFKILRAAPDWDQIAARLTPPF